MSQEAAVMAARLREVTDAGALCYSGDAVNSGLTAEAVALLNLDNAASQEDVRQADLVAILDCDLLNEAPMMALAVRQAWRNGAKVYVVPFDSAQGTISGNDLKERSPRMESWLGGAEALPFEFEQVTSLSGLPFSEAANPVVVSGITRNALKGIQTGVPEAVKVAFILNGPNAFGTALLALEQGAVSLPEALAGGKIKGIIALEADLSLELPPEIRVLAAADWMPTHLIESAEIVLPVTSWVEMNGTYINHEGRAQRFKQVMQPGLPIRGLTPELHPPRTHRHDPPGGEMRPSWRIVSDLLKLLWDEQSEEAGYGEKWKLLESLDTEGEGIMIYERNQKQ
jgi:NADH-quinone oxidoreductase subunit G